MDPITSKSPVHCKFISRDKAKHDCIHSDSLILCYDERQFMFEKDSAENDVDSMGKAIFFIKINRRFPEESPFDPGSPPREPQCHVLESPEREPQ